jgi:hypothetical protein
MAEKAQVRTHCRHPVQAASSATTIQDPKFMEMAPVGQRTRHSWHPAQRSSTTVTCGLSVSDRRSIVVMMRVPLGWLLGPLRWRRA